MRQIPIIQVGDVLVSPDIITEFFCCDIGACRGACCVEGDAGAPVTLDEAARMEESLEAIWPTLSGPAREVIGSQGVAYADEEGELVTCIVRGRDCVFTCHEDGRCLCAIEKAWQAGKATLRKPISCALYPIREKRLNGQLTGLNYHKWDICEGGRRKGRETRLPLYRFLRQPLTQRFGSGWYAELERTAAELRRAGCL